MPNDAHLQDVRQEFIATPQVFLRRNHLFTPGASAPHISQQMKVYLTERAGAVVTRPGSRLGLFSRPIHSGNAFTIQCRNPNWVASEGAKRAHDAQGYLPKVSFRAHWIATSFYPTPEDPDAPPPFPWYTLPNAEGPDLMFTQQLTGCSFLYRPAVNGTEVAHIMPTPNVETGAELEARLRAQFADTPNITIYGRSRYNQDRQTTIVGARDVNAEWQFYAQKQDLHSNDIRSVNHI